MSMLELAHRVEAAVGPDRDLDQAISTAMGEFHAVGWEDRIRDFTGSLDAALSVVPDGWQGDGLKWWEGERATCELIGSRRTGDGWVHYSSDGRVRGEGWSAPLALCSAALRARHALALSKGSEG
jgi:hypothetical protein